MTAEKLRSFMARGAIWGFIVLELIFFSIAGEFLSLSDKAFMDWDNMLLLFKQSAPIGIIALGMTVIMINGNIDLSVGAVLALASALAIGLQDSIGVWPAVFCGLLSGVALGALNGTIIALSGIHSFIVTLGALIGVRGLVFIYTGEDALMVSDFSYTEYPEIYLGPLSITAMIFLGLAFLFQWILTSTRHGREAYSVGDNIEAAHDAGINVKRNKIINFTICGGLAAVAGILTDGNGRACSSFAKRSRSGWSRRGMDVLL